MLKWGIIGTGRIARRFMEGLSYSEKGEIYALASLTNADKLQAEFPNLMVYDDYFTLLDDPKVDIFTFLLDIRIIIDGLLKL